MSVKADTRAASFRTLLSAGLVFIVAGLLSACGDGSDSTGPSPTTAASSSPSEESSETPVDTPPCTKGFEPSSAPAPAGHLRVFFWCAGQLRGIDRAVSPSPENALRLSVAGPDAKEVDAGYEGGFYSADIRGEVRVGADGTATVDFEPSSLAPERFLASSAFAEKSLAATLETLPGIQRVRLLVGGRPLCDYTSEC